MEITDENIMKEAEKVFSEHFPELYLTERIKKNLLPILKDGFKRSEDILTEKVVRDSLEEFFSKDRIISFIRERQPNMAEIPASVVSNIKEYMEKYFDSFDVSNIFRKSNHLEDDYLYMVIGRTRPKDNHVTDIKYACWSCYNANTDSLNYGHYNMPNERTCRKLLEEQFNDITDEPDKFGIRACEKSFIYHPAEVLTEREVVVNFHHKSGR